MAKRWNCSNKFKGRKVNKVYLDVLMLLSWKEKEKVLMNKLSYTRENTLQKLTAYSYLLL